MEVFKKSTSKLQLMIGKVLYGYLPSKKNLMQKLINLMLNQSPVFTEKQVSLVKMMQLLKMYWKSILEPPTSAPIVILSLFEKMAYKITWKPWFSALYVLKPFVASMLRGSSQNIKRSMISSPKRPIFVVFVLNAFNLHPG